MTREKQIKKSKTMKKKNLALLTAAFLAAITINLQAQDSSDGIVPGPLNPVTHEYCWSIGGNFLSITTGSKLGSTNAFPVRICANDTTRLYITPTGCLGVNTESPLQKLHVVEGNVLISRTSERAGGSTNGSLLFGDAPSSSNPYGKYGIEYVGNAEEGYGLNFWKPYNTSGGFMNNVLFLDDMGNVGIGTNNPQAKLAVNGEVLARICGIVLARIPMPTFVIKIANVTGIAIFIPTRKTPLVMFIIKSAMEGFQITPSRGTLRKL